MSVGMFLAGLDIKPDAVVQNGKYQGFIFEVAGDANLSGMPMLNGRYTYLY